MLNCVGHANHVTGSVKMADFVNFWENRINSFYKSSSPNPLIRMPPNVGDNILTARSGRVIGDKTISPATFPGEEGV